MRVAYLFTTFPVRTETFLQREVRSLRAHGVEVDIWSLWGGEDSWEGQPVRRFSKLWWLIAPLFLLTWLVRRPSALLEPVPRLLGRRVPSLLNFAENLVGWSFALCFAGRFKNEGYDWMHAAWATMPTAAANTIERLVDLPFSMEAHAYDVFEHGGDWSLPGKLRAASFVRTSTEATRRRLLELGSEPSRTLLIRRGLDVLPPYRLRQSLSEPIRFLSVGRLVPKKGYEDQLEILAAMRKAGLKVEARIVGTGPLERELPALAARLKLSEHVHFLGSIPFGEVLEQYRWADLFLFTGKVAPNGDRDGLPNVLPEAMAAGIPVLTTDVSGTTEAVTDGRNGHVLAGDRPQDWVETVKRLQDDPEALGALSRHGLDWVHDQFDSQRNTAVLEQAFRLAVEAQGVYADVTRAFTEADLPVAGEAKP